MFLVGQNLKMLVSSGFSFLEKNGFSGGFLDEFRGFDAFFVVF